MTTTQRRRHHHGPLTFYYSGFQRCRFCTRRHGFGLGKGSGLLDSEHQIFFSCCRAGFITFPGQISRFLAQYTRSGQPSTTTQLHVLLRDGLHLQARPDNSHGQSAKYAGNVDEPCFRRRLLFNLRCCWFFGPSSRARFWPALHGRHLRLDNSSRPCVICNTSSSTVGAGLRLLSVSSPTMSQSSPSPRSTWSDDGISCGNSEFKLSAYNTSRQVLDYFTRGTYLLGCRLCHLQLLGDTFARHIARLPRRRRETSLQASRWILDKGGIGQPRSAEPGPQLKSLLQRLPVLLLMVKIRQPSHEFTFGVGMSFIPYHLVLTPVV
jgi:hypothetical protein